MIELLEQKEYYFFRLKVPFNSHFKAERGDILVDVHLNVEAKVNCVSFMRPVPEGSELEVDA